MPIKPSPFRQCCSACGWQGRVIDLPSDVLSPKAFSQILDDCPKCGAAQLTHQPVGTAQAMLGRALGQLLGKRF